jgi:hypothetical protein
METMKQGTRRTMYVLIALTVAAIGYGIFASQQKAANPKAAAPAAKAAPAGPLVAAKPSYDFGKISMAAGKVSHKYWISNESSAPVTINKIYTSCMCTEATLLTPSRKKGPFGMPGHGVVPTISEPVAPGQAVQIEVVFDPAAHGPSGVGPIDRVVVIDNNAGRSLELRMAALVRP